MTYALFFNEIILLVHTSSPLSESFVYFFCNCPAAYVLIFQQKLSVAVLLRECFCIGRHDTFVECIMLTNADVFCKT